MNSALTCADGPLNLATGAWRHHVSVKNVSVTRVVEHPDAFLFFTHPASYRDMPRRGLDRTQDEQLRAFLISRGLLAADAQATPRHGRT